VRQAAFETDARIAHRLLSQRAAQHDAILATLALLQPNAAGRRAAAAGLCRTGAAGAAAGPRPPLARRRCATALLDAAEVRSRNARRAVLARAEFGPASGRYLLVQAATPASFALLIDAQGLVPAADWPFTPGGRVQASLAHGGHQRVLTAGGPRRGMRALALRLPQAAGHRQPALRGGGVQAPGQRRPALGLDGRLVGGAGRRRGRGGGLAPPAGRGPRRAQELLRLGQVGRLNALGELAAGMAHELNQPLTAVSAGVGAAQRLLADDPPDLDTARLAMAQATQQARRAAEVVARLRRLVERPDVTARVQPCAVAPLLRGALDLLEPECRRLGVAVQLQVEPADLQLMADPVALEQIAHNLLSNALQALAAVPAGDRRLRLQARLEGGSAVVEVTDSGAGLSPDVLPHLFEPFFTTRNGGLGLGPEPVRVPGHRHGRVAGWRAGRAARCRLHAAAAAGARRPLAMTPSIVPLIQLVDDDAAVRDALSLLIGTVGLRVQTWGDPQAFVDGLDREAIGAIVLDVRMPGLGGIAVLERLRAAGVDQPVVMLTGHGTVELCRRAFKSGAVEFLEKPVDDQLLLDTLQQAVRQHVRSRQRRRADRAARDRFALLSEREREVLGLICAGLTNKEVGRALGLSPRTVETHRAHLFDKLEAPSLAHLIRHYADLVADDDAA
jgi:FixJ family two-component response regulator/signal transduction histidine kinase